MTESSITKREFMKQVFREEIKKEAKKGLGTKAKGGNRETMYYKV